MKTAKKGSASGNVGAYSETPDDPADERTSQENLQNSYGFLLRSASRIFMPVSRIRFCGSGWAGRYRNATYSAIVARIRFSGYGVWVETNGPL